MGISIITPHYNDFEGLQRVYKCLQDQSEKDWQWVIVDDMSDAKIRQAVQDWRNSLRDIRLELIFNPNKTNASVCRNLGAEAASFQHIVFLDSDDIISSKFVANRDIKFQDFAVLKNTAVINENEKVIPSSVNEIHYLDCFLRARFLWPITSILWDKSYFKEIGKFHPKLPRLQDVELAIRGLQRSSNYTVIDNNVDFYYRVRPIRSRKYFFKPVSDAVYIFISEILDSSTLTKRQMSLLSGYYYLTTRYFERSSSLEYIDMVYRNLNLFYKKKYINILDYSIGFVVLRLYGWRAISGQQFLRINRYVFKPKGNSN